MDSVVDVEQCPQRDRHVTEHPSRLEFESWCLRKAVTHRQRQCSGCGRWVIWEPRPTPKLSDAQLVLLRRLRHQGRLRPGPGMGGTAKAAEQRGLVRYCGEHLVDVELTDFGREVLALCP